MSDIFTAVLVIIKFNDCFDILSISQMRLQLSVLQQDAVVLVIQTTIKHKYISIHVCLVDWNL